MHVCLCVTVCVYECVCDQLFTQDTKKACPLSLTVPEVLNCTSVTKHGLSETWQPLNISSPKSENHCTNVGLANFAGLKYNSFKTDLE